MGTARPVRQGRQAWEDDRQWVAVVRGHEVIYKGKSCPQAAMHLKPGMHFGKGENIEEAIREGRAAARVQFLSEMECSAAELDEIDEIVGRCLLGSMMTEEV